MATKEIAENTALLQNVKCANFENAKKYLDLASELLLFRRFEECIKTCEKGIIKAKLEIKGNPDIVEALCVVGIQAYAELNNWHQVLPFVQKVYSSIEDCPFRVVQLCLLLHAKVEEYSQCYAIASIWLKDVENLTNPNYVLLVEIYITNVLLPRGQDNLIDPFIDSCPGLTSEQRKTLHNNYINKKVILPGSDEKNQNIDRDMERETTHKKPPTLVKDSWLLKVVKNVKFAIFGDAPLYSYKLVKITIIAVCLYLLSLHHKAGFLTGNFERVGTLFQGVVKAFKSLFGPRTYITR